MLTLKRIVAGIVLFAFVYPTMATPSEDLDVSKDKLSNEIVMLGRLIGTHGDRTLRTLFDTTKFSVRKIGFPNIGVSTHNGQSTIVAAAEYHLMLTYIADTNFALMGKPKLTECSNAYSNYLTKELARSNALVAQGKSIGRIMAPEEFGLERTDICSGFPQSFPIPVAQRNARDAAVNSAVILTLLHEFGHIALNHNKVDFEVLATETDDKRKMKKFLELSKRSRDQEDAADQWAVDQAVALGAVPFDIVNPTLIGGFMAFTGVNCDMEKADDHSNGVTRVEKILARYISITDQKSNMKLDPRIRSLANQYIALARKARSKLDCDSQGI